MTQEEIDQDALVSWKFNQDLLTKKNLNVFW